MSISKADEIKILAAAVKKLGNDSYLGPELARLIPWIEMEIRSDICPDLRACVEVSAMLVADRSQELKEMEGRLRDLAKIEKEKQAEVNRLDRELHDAAWRARDAINNLRGLLEAA